MLAEIDLEARKQTGISFQQTDEIDDQGVNIATELDETILIRLCEKFFELIDKDDDNISLKKVYAESSMRRDELIQSYYEYINQRLGGRPYFSDRRGYPNLISFHAQIGITAKYQFKWLAIMEDAIDVLDDIITSDIKSILMTFFTHLCSKYQAATKIMNDHENAPMYDDDFPVNCPVLSSNTAENEANITATSADAVSRHANYRK